VTGDEALIASGLMDAEAFYRALAAETRLPFRAGGFAVHPLARSSHAILAGLAPLAAPGEGAVFAFAPRGTVLADMLARGIGADLGLLITTPSGLRDAVFAACADSIARDAAEGLARRKPEESFHGSLTLGQTVATHALAAALGVAALAIGGTAWMAAMLLFSGPFLGLTAIKLAATLEPVPVDMPLRLARDDDRDLPVYTILVPLYRESRVVGRLLRAIRAIDYPAAKMDVKFLVEEGDHETASAVAAHALPGYVEVITVPPGSPRTKPRALNVGLPVARGRYLVVYDAEDVPDPGQLRMAFQIFDRSEADVACLQARLVIDNTEDGILTRGIR